MINRLGRHHRSKGESGFTLIELLVVIIILGILAAVVVFAVGGVGDKGKEASVTIDARTIRTAEEAYCGQNGRYGSGAELIAGGFLSDLPQYHAVAAQNSGGGSCNGWSFSMLRTTAAGANPGTFEAIAHPFPSGGTVGDLIRLESGKVIALQRSGFSGTGTAAWDPATGLWTTMESGPSSSASLYWLVNSATLITDDPFTPGDQCGAQCGQIMLHGESCFTPGACSAWHLFDPDASSGQWSQVPPTNIDPASSSNSYFQSSRLFPLRNYPHTPGNECGENCGKYVLGAVDGSPEEPELYDPLTNTIVPFSYGGHPFAGLMNSLVPTVDGRLMLAGFDAFTTNAPVAGYLDPATLQFTDAPTPIADLTFQSTTPSVVLPSGEIYFRWPGSAPAIFSNEGWRTTPDTCDPDAVYCHLFPPLPDGRLLAFSSTSSNRISSGPYTQRAYLFNPATNAWTQTADPPSKRTVDGVVLDPRNGPCGEYCNKVLISGLDSMLFTP